MRTAGDHQIALYHQARRSGMDARQASLYSGAARTWDQLRTWDRLVARVGFIAGGFCLGFILATYHWYQEARPMEAPAVQVPPMPAITDVPLKLNKQVEV